MEIEFAGKRVAVIGTGSSRIKRPVDRGAAAHLCLPGADFALPAQNGPVPADRVALLESDRAGYREQARWSLSGVPWPRQTVFSWQLSDAGAVSAQKHGPGVIWSLC
jgi:hypothetical protein